MKFAIPNQDNTATPPIVTSNWGRLGGGVHLHKRTTPRIFGRAKQLHREMTPTEARLWAHLRAHRMGNVHFRNQHAIGNYIADFCAPRSKLIIELDGSQHLEQDQYDRERTAFFESKGYRVLRFWNSDVTNNFESVLSAIWTALQEQNNRSTPDTLPGSDKQ